MYDSIPKTALLIAWGFMLGFVPSCIQSHNSEVEKELIKTQTVERGVAEWRTDKEGRVTWHWKE